MKRWALAALLGVPVALMLPAQEAPPAGDSAQSSKARESRPALVPRTHDERERSYQAEHRIILNVLVTDANGKPATGLTEGDFALFENRQPRKIAAFRSASGTAQRERVHVVLVLDSVNNSARTLAIERRELERFLERNRGQLKVPISIVVLSSSGVKARQATRDPDVLRAELKDAAAGLHPVDCADEGGIDARQTGSDVYAPALDLSPRDSLNERMRKAECLNMRFTTSVAALNRIAREQVEVPGRAIMIWIGEGWPLLLGQEFAPDTPAQSRNYFDYLAELSTSLREAQITLDAVSSPDLFRKAEPGAEKLSSVPAPETDVAHTADFALPRLVRQTGGRILEYDKDLANEIAESIADADSYYVLAFDAAPAQGVGEYRELKVEVDRPGLKVRTNTAYFARP